MIMTFYLADVDYWLNVDQIESLRPWGSGDEAGTEITMASGAKYVVEGTPDTLAQDINNFRRAVTQA